VGERTDEDHDSFSMANLVVGGQFTARINLNLREDKGYTYGARSSTSYSHLPGLWRVSSSVKTDTTGASIHEILGEIRGALGDEPITPEELTAGRTGRLGGWPMRYENPGYLLDQVRDVWLYDLPEDWISGYPDRVRALTLEQTQAAWDQRISTDALSILVVGDAQVIVPSTRPVEEEVTADELAAADEDASTTEEAPAATEGTEEEETDDTGGVVGGIVTDADGTPVTSPAAEETVEAEPLPGLLDLELPIVWMDVDGQTIEAPAWFVELTAEPAEDEASATP
jgi:hypothetical protein